MIITTKDKTPVFHRDQSTCKSCQRRSNISVNIHDPKPQWTCFFCQEQQGWIKSKTYKKLEGAI
jgi:hypothetical protein